MESTRVLLLPIMILLLVAASCNKDNNASRPTVLNTWELYDRSQTGSVPTIFTAEHIRTDTNGTFKAVGTNPADSIVFHFAGNQLPVSDLDFVVCGRTTVNMVVSFEAWMNGRHYLSTGPKSMYNNYPDHLRITDGKIGIEINSGDAQDESTFKSFYITSNLHEP